MAYAIRYRAQYKNNSRDIKIEVLKKDYVGAIYDVEGVTRTASILYKDKDDSLINGSEFKFSLFTKDNAQYTELLDAVEGEFIGKLYIDNVLKHSGELDVENIQTQYFNYTYEYDLGFNDRLAKLDNFTISDELGDEIQGDNSLLWYIKQALIPTNLELDFAVVLNTKEDTLLTATNDNALSQCTINAERFKRVKDGKKEIYTNKEVLEAILKPFNLKLYQADNKFFIVNNLEVNSFQYNYLYSDLSLINRLALSNTVDISTFNFERSNTLTKNSALKRADTTFTNKSIRTNLINNPNFDTATLVWFNNEAGINASIINNELAVSSDAIGKYVYSEDYPIVKIGDNDIIEVEFEYYLFSVTFINAFGQRNPELEISLIYENATKVTYTAPLSEGGNVFKGTFNNIGTGNYKIEIRDKAAVGADYSAIQYRLDNVRLVPISQEDTTTYDRFYTITNTDNTATQQAEDENLLIADGIQAQDVGNLKVGGTLTELWSSFDNAESQPLAYVFLLNKLRKRQKPNNVIKLTIIDESNINLQFNSNVVIDGKDYVVKEYEFNYSDIFNYISLELVEVNYTSFNYTIENTTLTSVDGESTSNTSANFTETDPTVPTFVKSITQADINEWDNKVDRWETWLEDFKAKKDVLIENSVNTTINAKINNNGIFEGINFVFNGVDGSGGVGGSGGGGTWGSIIGTLSDQTDLWNSLQNIDASRLNSGTLSTARIPNLSASKITSGTFSDARISFSSVTQHLGNYVDRSTNQSINGSKSFIDDTTFDANINLGDLATTTNRHELKLYGNEGGLIRFFTGNVNENIIYTNNGDFNIRNITNSPLNFWTNNSIRTTIAANGNVGIGTSSPTEKLEVNDGEIKVDNGKSTSILTFTENGTNRSYVGQLGDLTTSIPRTVLRNITRGSEIGIIQSTGDIYLSHSGVNADVGLRVVSNGNVGIGTSSPTEKLEVNGVVKATNFVFG